MEDKLNGTTIHLYFTGYELPLETGFLGSKHVGAYFLGTLVYVFNSGDWVADIDVLAIFRNDNLKLVDAR